MRPSYATRSLVTRVSGTTIFVLIGYSETTTVSARISSQHTYSSATVHRSSYIYDVNKPLGLQCISTDANVRQRLLGAFATTSFLALQAPVHPHRRPTRPIAELRQGGKSLYWAQRPVRKNSLPRALLVGKN